MQQVFRKIIGYEIIAYLFFAILTTVADWGVYIWLWICQMDYRILTAVSWPTAVLFAFITNKLLVFRKHNVKLDHLWDELIWKTTQLDCFSHTKPCIE